MTYQKGDRVALLCGFGSLNGECGIVHCANDGAETAIIHLDCDDSGTGTMVSYEQIRALDAVELLARVDIRPWWKRALARLLP